MNRIILIGNGFDLAHKMKTGYKDFIDYYWESTIKEIQSNKTFYNDEFSIDNVPEVWDRENTYKSLRAALRQNESKIIFKNKFLEIISNKAHLQNWVDIECEYYELLKEIINKPESSNYDNVSKLNSDFERIKRLLEDYLSNVEKKFQKEFRSPFIKSEIGSKIYSSFRLRDFTENTVNEITKQELIKLEKRKKNLIEGKEQITIGSNIILGLDQTRSEKELRKILLNDDASKDFDLIPNQIIFLNFNYTSTALYYLDSRKYLTFPKEFKKEVIIEIINIHGELNNNDNPIIFGFGDEIDSDYKKIEALNDNEFLQNIKSINYLETDNYKRILRIINDDFFQVFIFGHSCGLSDRTLLNTLFEHPNCVSIKPFYHKIDESRDNFSDIVRNISRNFNDKSIMREKVVNKTYCVPMID